jgi:hypothetical protein
MTWILALANYLEAAPSQGTKASNLFIGIMPSNPNLVISLTQYAGDVVETQASGIQLHRPSLQVRVRGVAEDYATPLARITAIQNKLAAVSNQTLSGIYFLRVRPITSIIAIGQDENLKYEFTCNFEVLYA